MDVPQSVYPFTFGFFPVLVIMNNCNKHLSMGFCVNNKFLFHLGQYLEGGGCMVSVGLIYKE